VVKENMDKIVTVAPVAIAITYKGCSKSQGLMDFLTVFSHFFRKNLLF